MKYFFRSILNLTTMLYHFPCRAGIPAAHHRTAALRAAKRRRAVKTKSSAAAVGSRKWMDGAATAAKMWQSPAHSHLILPPNPKTGK